MTAPTFTDRVIAAIRAIPSGTVATYGQIASLAGNRRAARQVVRVLHACSQKERLPWHRVVNREGRITLPHPDDAVRQRHLLEQEGIVCDAAGTIKLERFLWRPDQHTSLTGYSIPFAPDELS